MCGIAGFVNFSHHSRDAAGETIRRMTDRLAHRGPDAEGIYTDGMAALGHRRLSIIDLEGGSQPMTDRTGRYTIVFNGEIYNFPEIRCQLEDLGHVFDTASDTEVILYAYAQWGDAAVEKLNGMFAFALWDSRDKVLFLARDRVGKKPLYYTWDGRCFAFASELKAITAGGFTGRDIRPQALDAYFSFGYIPAPFTIYRDVDKLAPATRLTVSGQGISRDTYWDLDFRNQVQMTMDEAAEELESLMRDAVRCRLMSDVPLGAFLSSGLDSSLVVSFMAELAHSPVRTHTVGFGNQEFCELSGARLIAEHFGTRHTEFMAEPEDIDSIRTIAGILDEPFADSSALPTWHVCRHAREKVTVALTGDGGDEAFGGYTFRYLPHVFESRIRTLLPRAWRRVLLGPLGQLYPGTSRLPKPLRLKTIFENLSVSDARAFFQDLVWLRQDTRRKVYTPEFMGQLNGFHPGELVLPLYHGSPAADPLSRSQYTDIHFYMTDDVLVKADRMSMAHGLELRNPLLDYRILEFGARLPAELKMNQSRGKLILRELAGRRLPASIVNLPKKGFSIPAAQWLRTGLKEMCLETMQGSRVVEECLNPKELRRIWDAHQSGQKDHSVFLWSVMMLGLWEKEYGNT
ncbi:MAG TPA: asparagine synthase (glutamine-hydrolyzing) [Desulfobacteraceae bacterium]|nr:asparagine synthase (glutamine-hydrolyzing) [Desulfobacteraceae bacterium]